MSVKLIQLLFKPLSNFGVSRTLQATALWSMLESFSSPLFSLLLIPILTHNIGLEKYGLYVMIFAFVNFFSFTGLGMSTSITYYLAANQHSKNSSNIAGKLGTALSLSLIGTITFSLFFIIVLTFFKARLLATHPQLVEQKYIVYSALLLLILTQCDMVISAALKGLQQFKASSKLEFAIRLVSFISLLLIANFSKNLASIIIISVMLTFIGAAFRFKKLSIVGGVKLKDVKINKQYIGDFFYFGKWMTLQTFSGAILSSLDKIMLGLLFNTSVVGTYNIILSITQLSHYFLASACSFILPKISASSADIQQLKKYYYKSLVASFILVLILSSLILIFYPLVKNHFHLLSVNLEFFLLLGGYGILAMCVPPYYFALGFGKVKMLSNINTISAAVGIIAIMIFVNKYEILGAAISRALYTLTVTLTFIVPAIIFKKNERVS